MLWALRCGTLTDAHIKMIQSRDEKKVSPEESRKFESAQLLCATHADEQDFNMKKLSELGEKVFRIKAAHKGGRAAQSASDSDAGLPKVVNISPGSKVMLTRNLWTSKGLSNGSIGYAREVIADKPGGLPICVLVKFPGYTGPPFCTEDPKLVPIVPCTSHFGAGESLSRTTLPLVLAWAITIHKAQGATFDACAISLGPREIASGLTYTALSRVRSIQGFLLRGICDRKRFTKLNKSKHHEDRRKAEEFLDNLSRPSGGQRK